MTKLGLWLMPAPRRLLPFALALADLATLGGTEMGPGGVRGLG